MQKRFLTYSPKRRLFLIAVAIVVLIACQILFKQALSQPEAEDVVVLRGHTRILQRVQFISNERVITEAVDNTTRIWDAATGKELVRLRGKDDRPHVIMLSPDGQRIFTSDEGVIRVWNANNGKELAAMRMHSYDEMTTGWHREARDTLTAFSPDGNRIVITSFSDKYSSNGKKPLTNNRISQLWDATSGKVLATLGSHLDAIRTAEFSPDSTRFVTTADNSEKVLPVYVEGEWVRATGKYENVARVYNAADGKELFELRGHTAGVTDAVFSPDGKIILTRAKDNAPRLWDAATGKELAVLTGSGVWRGQLGFGWEQLFSPDGKLVITASEDVKTIHVWDVATGKEIATLRGHDKKIWSAQFSPDSARIITQSSAPPHAGDSRLWDVATGKTLAVLLPEKEIFITFSPDSTHFATRDSEGIRIKATADGKEVAALRGVFHGFSPDGKLCVTTHNENDIIGEKHNIVRLWNVATGKELAVLRGHTDTIIRIAFSPDAKHLITASTDHTARIWNIHLTAR
ncbi:MAG: WD40 repeat domain-containing protein [Phycisphaerales bacterium]|nr:WD40 repeat domain-containing protein [Phycisphaerales bacterium]